MVVKCLLSTHIKWVTRAKGNRCTCKQDYTVFQIFLFPGEILSFESSPNSGKDVHSREPTDITFLQLLNLSYISIFLHSLRTGKHKTKSLCQTFLISKILIIILAHKVKKFCFHFFILVNLLTLLSTSINSFSYYFVY